MSGMETPDHLTNYLSHSIPLAEPANHEMDFIYHRAA